jgi:uncharacterized tellurite resistance protein B-like protein
MKQTQLHEVLSNLYSLLIWSDGNVNEKEIALGYKMASFHGMDETLFQMRVKNFDSSQSSVLMNKTIGMMKTLHRDEQLCCIAWMCIIANADGFMDRAEWQMIYKIYHLELQLPLESVMDKQKKLSRLLHKENATQLVAVL